MKPYYIEFGKVDLNEEVEINFLELIKNLPFSAKRVYTLVTKNQKSKRGNHAHLNQDQLIMGVKGNSILKLTDKKGKIFEFNLDRKAVIVPKNHWIEIEMKPNSVLLCIASRNYVDLISNFDKNDFLR